MIEKRKILLVINPRAGRSSYEARLEYIEKKFRDSSLKFERFFTQKDGAGILARKIQADPQFSELVVLGGDGTLNYAVNELLSKPLPISIVSNGTGNDSVKSLHGEMNFENQVEIAIRGKLSRFDLGICNGKAFINGFGIGFDGQVVKEMIGRINKRGSHLDYLMTVLRIVAGFKEKSLRFTIDGKAFKRTVLLMTISNGTTFGGGFVINPFAKANDGLFDVCILNEISPLKRFWHLPKLKTGAHQKLKESEFLQGKRIHIEASDQLVAHLDGEFIGHPPFDISIVPEGLIIKTPS